MKAAPSVLLDDLRGKAGGVAFTKGRSGLVVRPRTHPRDPETPAQTAIRTNLARAAQVYRALTPAELAAWRAYAQSVTRTNPVQGTPYHPCANTAFMALAAKFLQIHTPDLSAEASAKAGPPVPTTPPETPFPGDTITISASATEHLSLLRQGEVGESANRVGVPNPSPQPLSPNPYIAFSASAPNTPGVTTELLLQPLVSPNRTPHARRYRTVAFHTFTDPLTVTVPAEEGWYAAAYRFVNPATGQSTPMVPLPDVILVPAATASAAA